MKVIDSVTVVVYTSDELKTALENNNGYTYIYFGSDITLTSGINISGTKSNVIIDGTYENVRYHFTDMKNLSGSSAIQAANRLILNVTVKNMDITGYNYYGVIYVPDSSTYQSTVVEYNNITYIGPQISFHPYGLTRFINSNITIQENYAAGNEVAECNKIEIGGTTTILHKSTGNSSFWFRNSNPSFTVLKNANVTFTSEARELLYGVSNLKFTVEENAIFNVTTKNGFSYGTFGTGETLIDKNASFSLTQTAANGSYSTWYSYGIITVNENANLSIINDFTNINASNYNINFQGSSAGFILNNPGYIILYNKVANIINTSTTINFNFKFSRINLFNKVISINSKISADTLPTYSWYKSLDISNVSGTFNSTTSTITTNNFTEEELTMLPGLTNFIFANKKIMSIGDAPLHINPITDESVTMSGKSLSSSSILIEYDSVKTVVDATTDGYFNYEYTPTLPIGTVVTFTSKESDNLIYKTKRVTIVYSGELTIDSYPTTINFILKPISLNPLLLSKNESIVIKITDSRIYSSDWKLYASINNDLKDGDSSLPNSIVFLDSDNSVNVLSTDKTLVYTGKNNDGSTLETDVTFLAEEGILAQIEDKIDIDKIYTATITWTLEE